MIYNYILEIFLFMTQNLRNLNIISFILELVISKSIIYFAYK